MKRFMNSELTPFQTYSGCVRPRALSHLISALADDNDLSLSHLHPSAEGKDMDMFKKRKLTGSRTPETNVDQSRCERFRHPPWANPLITWSLLAKKQRVVDVVKILLDIAKESADWFPPLKSALGGVTALIKHYEVLVG